MAGFFVEESFGSGFGLSSCDGAAGGFSIADM
jgi:hypothetical protein